MLPRLRSWLVVDGGNVDLAGPEAVTESHDAHFIAVDASDNIVAGGPVGPEFRARSVSAPVTVDGQLVGRVHVVFYSDQEVATPHLGLSWFLAAGAVATGVAIVAAVIVTRLLTRRLGDLAGAAESFAQGDRAARASTDAPGELGKLGRAFNEMADQVTRSEQARRRMSADIAHELRTPLTVLQAGLEELRDGLVPADPPNLSALHDQAVRLGRVVNDLSDLAHAESPSLQLSPERLDLADLASDALLVWRPRMDEAGLSLQTSLQMGAMVCVDPDRVSQVVTNLRTPWVLRGRIAGTCEGPCCCAWAIPVRESRPTTSLLCSPARTGGPISAANQAQASAWPWSAPSPRPKAETCGSPRRSTWGPPSR